MFADYLDKLYTSIETKSKFLQRLRYYSILRYIIVVIANSVLPLYYTLTQKSNKYRLYPQTDTGRKKIIVSLTSYPARIRNIWIVVESLIRQKTKPDMIVLWLSRDQFNSLDQLPKKLLNLQTRGLIIRLCEKDLKSHKKYFYALKEYPDDFIITVDDDIIYPSTLLSDLITLQNRYKGYICCHRAAKMKYDGDKLLPYTQWNEIKRHVAGDSSIFFTSGGGTLFPPYSLNKEVLNSDVFMQFCKYADDVWLNAMSRLNNTKFAKTDYYSNLLPVFNSKNISLFHLNVERGENDKQLNDIRNIYISRLGTDVFKCRIYPDK